MNTKRSSIHPMGQDSMKKGWRYELDLKPYVLGLTQSIKAPSHAVVRTSFHHNQDLIYFTLSIFRVSILYLSRTKMYFFWCLSISQLCHRLFDKISVKGSSLSVKRAFVSELRERTFFHLLHLIDLFALLLFFLVLFALLSSSSLLSNRCYLFWNETLM